MSKQAILNNVKASLRVNALQKATSHYTNPLKSTNQDKIQEYITFQSANKAQVIESSQTTLLADIQKVLFEANARKILYNLDVQESVDIHTLSQGVQAYADSINTESMAFIAYDTSIDKAREELFEIDTSIVCARCGVANLGVIGITSHKNAPRLSSLITRTCVVLLKKDDIVSNFFEGVQVLKAQGTNGALPSNMIFIAGPSRTADIELKTVFGVHGSVKSYIILY